MTNAVFYSVSPYGTGTLETGDGTIEITSGVATLSVAQTGNIGVGVCVEYNSLECWIAPNRIAFTSGGTTELLTGTKIAGGTSGATGIVRAIEVTSGTWAGGDAAGWIYFESTTGTWNSSEQINRTKPTSSTNIATTNGSLEGNIGNGNTEFVVKNATGGAAANQTSTSVTSVHHEWAALSDFETYFTDGSHINNTSLVTADVVVHACCYYDHDDQTTDTNVDFYGATTGEDNYVYVYTPIGEAESINNQRHAGTWDTDKFYVQVSATNVVIMRYDFIKVNGLQINNISTTSSSSCLLCIGQTVTDSRVEVDGMIMWSDNTRGIAHSSANGNLYLQNIVVDVPTWVTYTGATYAGLYAYNCIFRGSYTHSNSGNTTVAKNTYADHWYDANEWTGSNNAAADTSCPGTTPTDSVTRTDEFVDPDNATRSSRDYHLLSTAPDLLDSGTPLESDSDMAFWRDIIRTQRGASWDIGAFEYVSAGPSISIPVIMHHFRQQRL